MIIITDAVTLQANKHGSIPIPSTLSPAETIATIVPGLKSSYLLSLEQLFDNGSNVLLNKQNMSSIKYKEVGIEWEQNHHYILWEIIISSHPKVKKSVKTNNYTTIASHEILYASKHKYKIQHILSMTVHIQACTQQSPTSYIL